MALRIVTRDALWLHLPSGPDRVACERQEEEALWLKKMFVLFLFMLPFGCTGRPTTEQQNYVP